MGFLSSVTERIRGQRCEKLVQTIGNDVSFSTTLDAGIFKINIGHVINKPNGMELSKVLYTVFHRQLAADVRI